MDTSLTSEQRDYLATLKSSADSLLEIVNDILDFSKIESGRLELEATEFDLHELVGNTLRTMALRAHEKGLELCSRLGATVPECVIGDAGRLRQILLNLVGNAIKFTSAGEILVEVEQVACLNGEVELHFCVTDTGIGIPRDKQALIFERFAQADGSTTRNYGGTGLGLAICARLITLMEGHIWVDSVPGSGSTFHFTVRLEAAHSVGAGYLVKERETELSGVRALVIDDNPAVRRCITEMCSELGMVVSSVSSGSLALSLFGERCGSSSNFDLIIVERYLPDIDGFELVERLGKSTAASVGTVMMLTTVGHRLDTAQCREKGISAHLSKPIQKRDLISAIRTALGLDLTGQLSKVDPKSFHESPKALRVLVAEDNLVNQKTVLAMLRKMGHSPEVTNNGQDAVQMLESEYFDLVLMDVQMPLMDGLAATRCIRANEHKTGRHIPIIALTAHATEDYRARCLEVGMDAYIAKPVKEGLLAEVILSFFHSRSGNAGEPHSERKLSVWHRLDAITEMGGDEDLLNDIVDVFLEECPKQLAGLHQAVHDGDANLVEQISHGLKSELGYLHLTDAAILARDLETAGRNGQLEGASEILRKLEADLSIAILEMMSTRDKSGQQHSDDPSGGSMFRRRQHSSNAK